MASSCRDHSLRRTWRRRASGPAVAALDNYPDDSSEAGASVFGSSAEEDLDGAAASHAGFPSDPGPNTAALDPHTLGSETLVVGSLDVPLGAFASFGSLGALSSSSAAESPWNGHAASGLLGPDGALVQDSAEADWGSAQIDLMTLGLSESGLAVDHASLELGAVGSEVISQDGVFLDPDGGVTGPGQYVAGDATLYLHSPLLDDASAQVSDLGSAVDATIEGIVADNVDTVALAAALGAPGVPAPECSVDSNAQADIEDLMGTPITSKNQLVTLDFSTGSAEIHLEQLVDRSDPWAGGDDAGLNGLAPNTELLDSSTYPQVAQGVDEIIEELTTLIATAVAASLPSVSVTCQWSQEGPLPDDVVDVTWGPIGLGDAAAGTFPPVETNCQGPTAPDACAELADSVETGGSALTKIFTTAYDALLSDEATAQYELQISDTLTGLVTETIKSALSPAFDVLTDFLSLQVNHQATTTCTTSDGTEMLASVEVSALSLLVTGVEGRLGLGNSGVRVDACAAALTPEISVSPTEVLPGGEVEITGSGYTPDSTVSVQLAEPDGTPVGGVVAVSTDEAGSFVLAVIVSSGTLPGGYLTVGTDDTTGTSAQTPLTVLAANTPLITADPSEVPAGGATTTVTGDDFTPDGMVTLSLIDADGNVLGELDPFPASDDGTFETVLTVSADAPVGADYRIVAIDEETGQETTTPFAIVDGTGGEQCGDSALTAPTGVSMPGTDVMVTGTGFPAGVEVAVQLTNPDGAPVGDPVTVTPAEDCSFEVTITVPEDAEPGEWLIVATPEDGSPGAQAPISIGGPEVPRTLEAWFQFDTVEQGGQQTFTASGFDPGEMVSATIHSTPISLTAQVADAAGVVSWTFTVPSTFEAGSHQGVATSTEQGDDVSASFEVTAAEDPGPGTAEDPGAGAADGTSAGDGGLAQTGSDAGNLAALSLLLLGAGALLICRRQILTRRSR